VGFGHCIGMCGPIVVSFSLGLKDRNRFLPNLIYHAGRISTYSVLGGILGAGGSFTGIVTPMAGLQKAVMILTGVLISVMGLVMTGWVSIPRMRSLGETPLRWFFSCFNKLSGSSGIAGFFTLGLFLGLIPCGPVYTALLTSARIGMESPTVWNGALSGSMLMLSFGLGTLPALLLVAGLSDMKWLKSRASVYRIGGVLMLGVGIYFLVKGIRY
jgi:uncharacterized protein